jgi:uncharacterized RDD family membrane protein YckC
MGRVVAISSSMNCPECEAVLADNSASCQQCGAQLAQKQPRFNATDMPVLPQEDEAAPGEEITRTVDWGFVLDREFDRLYGQFKKEEKSKQKQEKVREIRWGGFVRRACAFFIDLVVLSLLSVLLFFSSYVAYQVGLAAYDRTVLDDPVPLLRMALWGYLLLAAAYFVLFHGLDGRTIGKWLLGLRVVDRNQEPITYSQALVRLIGYLLSAFFGLGFLWIMFNRRKRGWHDLLARTWVIRESSFQDKGK